MTASVKSLIDATVKNGSAWALPKVANGISFTPSNNQYTAPNDGYVMSARYGGGATGKSKSETLPCRCIKKSAGVRSLSPYQKAIRCSSQAKELRRKVIDSFRSKEKHNRDLKTRTVLWIFAFGFGTGWMMHAICSDAEGFLVALMSFIAGYLALLSWGEGVRERGKDL